MHFTRKCAYLASGRFCGNMPGPMSLLEVCTPDLRSPRGRGGYAWHQGSYRGWVCPEVWIYQSEINWGRYTREGQGYQRGLYTRGGQVHQRGGGMYTHPGPGTWDTHPLLVLATITHMVGKQAVCMLLESCLVKFLFYI